MYVAHICIIFLQFLTNISEVVGGVSLWPSEEIRYSSSEVVSSFDTLGEDLISQENFTSGAIAQPQIIFSGQRVKLFYLAIDSHSFTHAMHVCIMHV